MKSRLLAVSLALMTASVATGLTAAAARANTVEVSDNEDGENGHPDIKSAKAVHTNDGRFKHTIVAYKAFSDANAPCLQLQIAFPKDETYIVCSDGDIVRKSNDSRSGNAHVERPDDRTVSYEFGQADIDGSDAYRWRAVVQDPDCQHNRCDRAPDSGWGLHAPLITYERWATRFLAEENAKACKNNLIAMVAWTTNEGTAARYNPLATTYRMDGSTDFNSTGVQNYASLRQGVKAVRLTIERGWDTYGYGLIVRRLRNCSKPMRTAKAIRASQWCAGCSSDEYVTGLIGKVRESYEDYAKRLISTV